MTKPGGSIPENDGEVVGWSDAGDPAAFVELFWRHGQAVHAYLARRTGGQDADDLLSEVWLRAFKGRANYDTGYPDARPWLYGIARHVLRAHWRPSHLPRLVEKPTASDPWEEADSRLDADAQKDKIHHVLTLLSDDEREVLLLVTWEQLTPAEVAIVLDIPQGTARSRLHRALSIFRHEFESDATEPLDSCPQEA